MVATAQRLRPPTPLTEEHDVSGFDSGNRSLDDFLKNKALKNEKLNNSRTYVVCEGDTVVAYFSLATGSIDRDNIPKKQQRNSSNPIPTLLLGRLAVTKEKQRKGIGKGILRHAMQKTLELSQQAGIRLLVVHAISKKAKEFYVQHGFEECPGEPLTLVLPTKDIQHNLAG